MRATSRPARGGRRGFTLVEVMAAVMILSFALVVMLVVRNQALARAADARNLSVSSRLGLRLLHRIEAGRVPELFDGYQGDFSEEGFPDFTYVIGIGDASKYATGAGDTDVEQAWRDALERKAEEAEENTDDPDDPEDKASKPERTRVFLTVTWPAGVDELAEFHLETLLPTWAVEQDFELYEEKWGSNLPQEVQ